MKEIVKNIDEKWFNKEVEITRKASSSSFVSKLRSVVEVVAYE